MNKRIKMGDASGIDARITDQLGELIEREDIVSQQKCSIFLQMVEYKRMSERMAERNEQLARENSVLVQSVEGLRQNKENSGNRTSGSETNTVDCKVVLLNDEVRRLTGVICELEKRLSRRELCGGDRGTMEEGAKDRDDPGDLDVSVVNEGVYRSVVGDAAELKARLGVVQDEFKEELQSKQLEIGRLRNEISRYSSDMEEMGRRNERARMEIEEYRRRMEESDGREAVWRKEMDECNGRICELERRVREVVADLGVKENRISQLSVEKEELRGLVEGYVHCSRRGPEDGEKENGDLEEEICSLVESLDKSLGENKRTIKRLEEEHSKNGRLESEVGTLRIANTELVSQNDKLSEEMRDLRRELRKYLDRNTEDTATDIRRLSSSVEENKRLVGEYKRRLCILSAEKDAVDRALENMKRQSRGVRDELSSCIKRSYELETENRRMGETIRGMGGRHEGDPDVFTQLEKYRSLLRCTLCDSRFKDTVITKCMHCFCKECVGVRIKMRDRKCPSCNEPFLEGDIRKIHL